MNYREKIATDFRSILEGFSNYLNFEADKESFDNTPERISKMYIDELLAGYKEKPEEILRKRFPVNNEDLVIVSNIPFVSLCAHHWLPFIGKAHFGYIPNNKEVVGLSKIPRLVQCYAKRLQVQEQMTTEIADAFFNTVKPSGCIIITEAEHLCAQIRGVQARGTKMVCSAIRGVFEKQEIKDEFLNILGKANGKY